MQRETTQIPEGPSRGPPESSLRCPQGLVRPPAAAGLTQTAEAGVMFGQVEPRDWFRG